MFYTCGNIGHVFVKKIRCDKVDAAKMQKCCSLQHPLLNQKSKITMSTWKKNHYLMPWERRWIHNKCHHRWEAKMKCHDVPDSQKRYLSSFNYVSFFHPEDSHAVEKKDGKTLWLAFLFTTILEICRRKTRTHLQYLYIWHLSFHVRVALNAFVWLGLWDVIYCYVLLQYVMSHPYIVLQYI